MFRIRKSILILAEKLKSYLFVFKRANLRNFWFELTLLLVGPRKALGYFSRKLCKLVYTTSYLLLASSNIILKTF